VVPPLRDRPEDIDRLVQHFLKKYTESKPVKLTISEKSLATMIAHDWPGNVRELANFVQRICVLASGPVIRFIDIPSQFLPAPIAKLYEENGLEEAEATAETQKVKSEDIEDLFDYELIIGLSEVKPSLPPEGIDASNVLNNIERNLVIAALDRCGWNVSKSAQVLSMPRTTLIQKMNKFGFNQKLSK
jgi:sigma-54 specific flagellar transcriptional regulator A